MPTLSGVALLGEFAFVPQSLQSFETAGRGDWASGPYWVSQCTSRATAVAARLWSFLLTITMRTMLLTIGTSVGPSIRTRVR